MSVLSDKWIGKCPMKEMIAPFRKNKLEEIVFHGLSSFGYDAGSR